MMSGTEKLLQQRGTTMSESKRYGKVGGGCSNISTGDFIENNPIHDIKVYNGFTGA